jgi:hypothetical protein
LVLGVSDSDLGDILADWHSVNSLQGGVKLQAGSSANALRFWTHAATIVDTIGMD